MSSELQRSEPAATPAFGDGRLGISLAGGGFRASLFHLGVLRRLAELDVLRRVEVLSTVSGGSIIGGMYVLLLKKYLEERGPTLSREQYIELIAELESVLVAGIRRNLRTRLIMNPLGVLLTLLTSDSLGRRMARLYERHLLAPILRDMDHVAAPKWWLPAALWPGQIRLKDLVVKPGGLPISGGLAAYNADQRKHGGSVVTSIVLNATSLNSGGRFHFSAVELGDWYLGYFRESEFPLLLARKALLGLSDDALRSIVAAESPPPEVPVPGSRDGERPPDRGSYQWSDGEAGRAAAFILRRREHERSGAWTPAGADDWHDDWDALFAVPEFPGRLDDAAFGLLRRAKLAAWYFRVGSRRAPPVLGGRTLSGHSTELWSALATLDADVAAHLTNAVIEDPSLLETLAEYLLELYWLRTAAQVSGDVRANWSAVRLGHAIGASACFPPVFPPFLAYGLYDDLVVPRLGLTDGGVYDNMGVTALVDEGCTEIIASDTSGLFNTTPSAASGHAGLATRIPNLLMRALGGVQRESLRERRRVSRTLTELAVPADGAATPVQQELARFNAGRRLDSLVYFHISSTRVAPVDPSVGPSEPPPLDGHGIDALDIAGLRTDLDAFGDVEVAALVNHGYDLADRYVRRYAPEIAGAVHMAQPTREPRPFVGRNAQRRRAERILRIGGARFFRALKLGSPVSWLFTAGVVGALGYLTLARGWSIDGILRAAGGLIRSEIALVDWLARTILRIGNATSSPAFLAALLGLAAALLLWSVGRAPAGRSVHGRRESFARRMATVRKWARALSGNVLWAVLLLPAVIAAACSALATASYLFFHLPFMRATKLGDGASGAQSRDTDTLRGRDAAQDPVGASGAARTQVPAGGA